MRWGLILRVLLFLLCIGEFYLSIPRFHSADVVPDRARVIFGFVFIGVGMANSIYYSIEERRRSRE